MLLKYPFRIFFQAINYIWLRMMLFLSEKRNSEGIELYAFGDAPKFFDVAKEALSFLKAVDQRRFMKVKRYLHKIAYLKLGIDYFEASLSAFIVDDYSQNDTCFFASKIVHEMTHAFLHYKRLSYTDEMRPRHEKLCLTEQYRFIRKAIGRTDWWSDEMKAKATEEWTRWFEDALKSEWWEPHQIRAKRFIRLRQWLRV